MITINNNKDVMYQLRRKSLRSNDHHRPKHLHILILLPFSVRISAARQNGSVRM